MACGSSTKVLDEGNSGTVSSKDYPYIEKFYKALRLKVNGRLDEAAGLLNECLQVRQDDDAVYFALSQIELMRGNDELSANYIEKAAALDPKNTWYIQELAYMYFERGDFQSSVANFKKLIDIEPRNIDWLYGYAEALSKAGKYEEAVAALNKTEDRTGPHPELTLQKYRLYMGANKTVEGEAELLKGLEKFPSEPSIIANLVDHYFRTRQETKAIEMLEKLVEADPENGRARLALAEIYMRQNKIDASIREMVRAIPKTDADLDSKMKVLIALYDHVITVSPELVEGLRLLVETYPDAAKPYSIQGDFLLKAELDEEALVSYKKALEFDKNQYPIWNQVLIMEYQLGHFDDLYTDTKMCMEYFPTVSTVYLLNGVAANQTKHYSEAEESLNYGLELVGSDVAMKAEFYGQLGEAAFGNKRFSSANEYYKKALDLAPNSNLIRNNFAYKLAYYNRDLDLAQSMIDQVFKNGGDQPQYNDTHGMILLRKGEEDKAIEAFEKALSAMKEDKLILEHLGDAYAAKGDMQKAIKYWEEAKAAGSSDELLLKKIADKKYYAPY